MRETNEKENQELGFNFLNTLFFKLWKLPFSSLKEVPPFSSLELFMSTKCNLKCTYCYLNRFGEELYPQNFEVPSMILKNLSLLLNWLIENDIIPPIIEYFSGEPLVNDYLLEGLDLILEKFRVAKRKPFIIIIPTNFTFLLFSHKQKLVEELLKKSRKMGLPIVLSASIDGKFCDKNRPFKNGEDLRSDKYYEKVFKFAKKYNFGFHPMIYSNLIEKWPQNFLWFQRNFDKFKIPWWYLYLLEVRNMEWSELQILHFSKFLNFLIKWTFQKRCHCNLDEFLHFLFELRGFNILLHPFINVGRGLGCSVQSSIVVRVGDLKIVPCHRTSYPPFELAEFQVRGNKIKNIKILNPELLINLYSFDAKNQPYCNVCLLKNLCSFGCLGSQFETNGDLFTPIPTVCQLEFVKIWTICKTFEELKILDKILLKVRNEKKQFAIRELLKIGHKIINEKKTIFQKRNFS